MTPADPTVQVSRTARRLARLFRIERCGGFERRPIETMRRLTERRGQLVEELMRLDAERRSFAPWVTTDLDRSMWVLTRAIDGLHDDVAARLDRLGAELRLRRGEGTATGLRDGGGQLLGRG
jgi:hypothetical protein